MDFMSVKNRCVEQSRATLDAICLDPLQRRVALKAINLILESSYAGRSGDLRSSKLGLNAAMVAVSEALGQAADAKWVVLNQVCGKIAECVDAFDPQYNGVVEHISAISAKNDVEGVIAGFLMRLHAGCFESFRESLMERDAEIAKEMNKIYDEESRDGFDRVGCLAIPSGVLAAILYANDLSIWMWGACALHCIAVLGMFIVEYFVVDILGKKMAFMDSASKRRIAELQKKRDGFHSCISNIESHLHH